MQTVRTYIYPMLLLVALTTVSCRKFVTIPEPINSMTTKVVFSTDAQAGSAMAGIYTQMINGTNGFSGGAFSSFSSGLTTLLGGLSSDELAYRSIVDQDQYPYYSNHLLATSGPSITLWSSAYKGIYGANAILEGIATSTSAGLTSNVRKELTGESKFIRAFCYFYLTNLFGDVPLALTVDFNKTVGIARTPQAQLYAQVIADLKDAAALLADDYSAGGGERIRPNKWAAMALLARVYLYTGNYPDAVTQSSAVIDQSGMYGLSPDPDQVFLVNSREAIWQLQQNTNVQAVGNATPEGVALLPNTAINGLANYCLSDQLMAAFETDDQRRMKWVGVDNNVPVLPYYPNKYKIGGGNSVQGGIATEYYMVLRLAEQYLIRAEALARGGPGGAAAAIDDINVIRHRAGLGDLDPSLNGDALLTAIAHERQVELFAEWGHRWLDLKRTGKAHDVLSAIPQKQPWQGDYQLLYPIPISEIKADPQLKQNKGY